MTKYVDIHTHHPAKANHVISIYNAGLGEDYSAGYFSLGMHPYNAILTDLLNYKTELSRILNLPESKLLAIGEIGTDRLIEVPLSIQEDVFASQLALGQKFKLPVILHSVRTWQDILSLRKKLRIETLPFVFHGFVGKKNTAEIILRTEHTYLSFGEALFKNATTQESFILTPLNRLFLETDESDKSIEEIYHQAARLKSIALEDLKAALYQNFIRVFLQKPVL